MRKFGHFAVVVLIAGLALGGSGSFAAETAKKPVKATKTQGSSSKPAIPMKHDAPEQAPAHDYSSYSSGGGGKWTLGVSGPLHIAEGTLGFGAYFDALYELNSNLLLGGESGFLFWSASAGAGLVSAGMWVLPLLPTVWYKIGDPSASFQPFIGASLGLAIAHVSVTVLGVTASATEAVFQGHLHAGGFFGASKNIFADLRLGVISSAFVLSPCIGLTF